MCKVYDMAEEIVSERSKREVCEGVKAQAKDYLSEEQLEKFEHDFYTVAEKYLFGGEKKD